MDGLRFGQWLTDQRKCQSNEGRDIEPARTDETPRAELSIGTPATGSPAAEIAQAAEILGVSERPAWRMLATYRKEGAAALAHGNRGRRPRNAVADDAAAAVIQLASATYAGANHTHLTELLRDREGIDLSRPTVRRILTQAGVPRSPQAKGRVERAAGTFQDRLVTELRLAGASAIDQANAVLRDFLPRYNTRFAVPADLPEPAYRPWDGNRPWDEILCFKRTRKVARDNTVKYQWRTLRLLPSRERQLRRCPGGSPRTHRRPPPGTP